jgi:hypothetical protein
VLNPLLKGSCRPLNIAVISIGESASPNSPSSAKALSDLVQSTGHVLIGPVGMEDNTGALEALMQSWVSSGAIDVILTTDCRTRTPGQGPVSLHGEAYGAQSECYGHVIQDERFGYACLYNVHAACIWGGLKGAA